MTLNIRHLYAIIFFIRFTKRLLHFSQNFDLTLFTMGLFGAGHRWDGVKKPPNLSSVTQNLEL